jgi:hypothetical protein
MEQDASNPQTVSTSDLSGKGKTESAAAASPPQPDAMGTKPQAQQGVALAFATPNTKSEHPPRVGLVLRIGVVGHRPDPAKRKSPDIAALRGTCRDLLRHIKGTFGAVMMAHGKLFAAETPAPDGKISSGLRLISSLAEGADQWVAAEAANLGYDLQAVLPFERDEYEEDFPDPEVLSEHRRLREAASTVLELDGCRARRGDSYLAAGRVLLNQTDLLIAIWDGAEEKGTGGTGQIVREALQRGITTLWVNWDTPTDWTLRQPAWRLLERPSDLKGDFDQLGGKVWELLIPPSPKQSVDRPGATDLRETYFSDRRRSWTLLGGWWNFFRDWWLLSPNWPKLRVPDFTDKTKSDWQKDWHGTPEEPREHKLPPGIIDWVETNYLPHYAWANQLSIYFANNYRSSFLWIYLLGAFAVLLALIGETANVSHLSEIAFIIAEVIVISAIIGLTSYGRRHRWHERWIDYRIIAEQLRLARFNCLLGGVWQQVNVPSHLVTSGNNPATTWMHWHARAVVRAAGLPNVVVNKVYLEACQELLLKPLISGQESYHRNNTERLRKVDRRLHRFGELLFLATLVACLIHLFVAVRPEPFGAMSLGWERWLIFAAAFMPALGAAMAAVRSQGEFHRVVQRSRAMQEELEQLAKAIANVPQEGKELNSQLLQQASEKASRLMYNETLDWRIVFQDRPLDWPA